MSALTDVLTASVQFHCSIWGKTKQQININPTGNSFVLVYSFCQFLTSKKQMLRPKLLDRKKDLKHIEFPSIHSLLCTLQFFSTVVAKEEERGMRRYWSAGISRLDLAQIHTPPPPLIFLAREDIVCNVDEVLWLQCLSVAYIIFSFLFLCVNTLHTRKIRFNNSPQ